MENNKSKKPLTLKHLLIAAGSAAAISAGISIGAAAIIISKQDKLPSYTVTFKNWNDEVLQRSKVKIGHDAVYNGPTPTRPTADWIDYKFTGWDVSLKNIREDTVIKAEFEGTHQTYEIKYYYDDTEQTLLDSGTFNKGEEPVYTGEVPQKDPTPAKHFVFGGWKYSETWETGHEKAYAIFNEAPLGMDIKNGAVTSYTGSETNVVIPSVWEGEPVTTIAENAFSPNPQVSIKNVVIPSSITTISDNAFYGASELLSVTFKADNSTGISNVETLGAGAFAGCSKLTTFTIPEKVQTLGNGLFSGCEKLAFINFNNVIQLGSETFKNCVELKECAVGPDNPKLHTISAVPGVLFGKAEAGPHANQWIVIKCLPGVDNLDYLKNQDIWLITDHAFQNCNKITEVNLTGSNVEQIDNQAFYESSITKFISGDKNITFNGNVFDNCMSLTDIVIGKNQDADLITSKTLHGCWNLANIEVATGGTTKLYSEQSVLYLKDENDIPTKLMRMPPAIAAVPDTFATGCTEINSYGFGRCAALQNYTLPQQIKTIGDYAFAACPNLTTVTLDTNGQLLAGEEIFQSCNALKTINLGKNITFSSEIKAAALSGCNALEAINVDTDNPYLVSDNGVLYTRQMGGTQWLMRYPSGKTDTSFVVPDTITSIAKLAFEGASNLQTLTLPATLTNVLEGAFKNCTNLSKLELATDFTFDQTKYDTSCFNGCSSLSNVVVHKINSTIAYFLSFVSNSLPEKGKALTLELDLDSDTEIPTSTFANRLCIKNLALGGHIETIGKDAFFGCSKLESIVSVPNTLTTIQSAAFGDCNSLKSLDLTNATSLATIYGFAFSQCTSLEIVLLPNSLTTIWRGAFHRAYSLKTIYYNGTKEQFISVCGGSETNPFTGTHPEITVNFSEGNPIIIPAQQE